MVLKNLRGRFRPLALTPSFGEEAEPETWWSFSGHSTLREEWPVQGLWDREPGIPTAVSGGENVSER